MALMQYILITVKKSCVLECSILTSWSPSCSTRQCRKAVCPTAVVIFRGTLNSKKGCPPIALAENFWAECDSTTPETNISNFKVEQKRFFKQIGFNLLLEIDFFMLNLWIKNRYESALRDNPGRSRWPGDHFEMIPRCARIKIWVDY